MEQSFNPNKESGTFLLISYNPYVLTRGLASSFITRISRRGKMQRTSKRSIVFSTTYRLVRINTFYMLITHHKDVIDLVVIIRCQILSKEDFHRSSLGHFLFFLLPSHFLHNISNILRLHSLQSFSQRN